MKHTEVNKNKISKARKKYLKDNPNRPKDGFVRKRNGEMSTSELLFKSIIHNTFIDKEYEYNFMFYRYSLDFAWPEKQACIEIDGEQHRLLDRKLSDEKKDYCLKEHGWKVLRINKEDLINNHEACHLRAKEFIDSAPVIDKELRWKSKKELMKIKIIHSYNLKKEKKSNIQNDIRKIEESDIDFKKFGWVSKVSKLLNVSHTSVPRFMKKYMASFYYEKCYKRKTP